MPYMQITKSITSYNNNILTYSYGLPVALFPDSLSTGRALPAKPVIQSYTRTCSLYGLKVVFCRLQIGSFAHANMCDNLPMIRIDIPTNNRSS